jgi:hypothetical protein
MDEYILHDEVLMVLIPLLAPISLVQLGQTSHRLMRRVHAYAAGKSQRCHCAVMRIQEMHSLRNVLFETRDDFFRELLTPSGFSLSIWRGLTPKLLDAFSHTIRNQHDTLFFELIRSPGLSTSDARALLDIYSTATTYSGNKLRRCWLIIASKRLDLHDMTWLIDALDSAAGICLMLDVGVALMGSPHDEVTRRLAPHIHLGFQSPDRIIKESGSILRGCMIACLSGAPIQPDVIVALLAEKSTDDLIATISELIRDGHIRSTDIYPTIFRCRLDISISEIDWLIGAGYYTPTSDDTDKFRATAIRTRDAMDKQRYDAIALHLETRYGCIGSSITPRVPWSGRKQAAREVRHVTTTSQHVTPAINLEMLRDAFGVPGPEAQLRHEADTVSDFDRVTQFYANLAGVDYSQDIARVSASLAQVRVPSAAAAVNCPWCNVACNIIATSTGTYAQCPRCKAFC